jgi:hypothetical protein
VLFFALLLALFSLPWWVSMPLIALATIYLPFYLEALFFGFLFDALYSESYRVPYIFLSSAAVLLLLLVFIRDRIRV